MTSHKTMIKEGYRRSNKNNSSHQIPRTYARLDSFKIHEMNIHGYLPRPIEDELCDKKHTQQVGSVTRQPQGFTPTIETIWHFNDTLKDLIDLLLDYDRRKLSGVHRLSLIQLSGFRLRYVGFYVSCRELPGRARGNMAPPMVYRKPALEVNRGEQE